MKRSRACFDLVQITDSHLYGDGERGLYGLNSYRALSEVVALAARRQPAFALLSGDLVHDETRQGYELLKRAIAPLGCPAHAIPGNHDDLKLMCQVLDCGKTIRHGGWQIILLNSQVAGEVGGCLGQGELEFLEQALTQFPEYASLICMHHQPLPIGSQWLDRIGLKNGEALFDIVDRHSQVKALVWGHVHQAFDGQRNGVRLLATPSTCIQFKPGADDFALDDLAPGYRWFRLFEDGEMETGIERLPQMPGAIDRDASGYDEDNG